MPTPAECWHRAEALVKLAALATQLYAREMLLERAAEFRRMATAGRVSPIRQIIVLTRDLPDGQVWVARFGNGYRHPSSCPGAFGEPIRTAWHALL